MRLRIDGEKDPLIVVHAQSGFCEGGSLPVPDEDAVTLEDVVGGVDVEPADSEKAVAEMLERGVRNTPLSSLIQPLSNLSREESWE
ncbi:MAG: hypothetical protein AMJ46_13015 [Latescibacteria bacterium DG_63]|nr:MAG: hypothetical protein AMJ46_13015 [Latescibacteria bacterium DG_63]